MTVALSALATCLVLPAIIRLLRPRFLIGPQPLAAAIESPAAVGASSPETASTARSAGGGQLSGAPTSR